MRILITNDDGIMAPALPHLVRFAETLGEVLTVAPKVEQSGKSHAIDFTRLIEIKPVDIGTSSPALSMDSTPADCVRYAVLGMKEHFDLIISGVNRGFNLGKDIVYSGTVGAIFEAARLGIPAVAVSTDPRDFTTAIEKLPLLADFFKEHKLFSESSIYNVNIPLAPKGINITRQGDIYFTDAFVDRGNYMFEQVGSAVVTDSRDLSLDTDSVRHGYISITPLTSEKTHINAFEKLKNLNTGLSNS